MKIFKIFAEVHVPKFTRESRAVMNFVYPDKSTAWFLIY